MASGINILIPMAGLGSRFQKEGYILPKPLIDIVGRPMISWLIANLHICPQDTLYLAVQQNIDRQFGIVETLERQFPTISMKFITLESLTRGAAETLHIILKDMSVEELNRPTISLDCDTIYFTDILQSFRSLDADEGCCFYFNDHGDQPIFSYIEMNAATHRIESIKEKCAISQHANTGAYGFGNAVSLRKHLQAILVKDVPEIGEFYTSQVVEEMIGHNHVFRAIFVSDFVCVGTPQQLQSFIATLRCPR